MFGILCPVLLCVAHFKQHFRRGDREPSYLKGKIRHPGGGSGPETCRGEINTEGLG